MLEDIEEDVGLVQHVLRKSGIQNELRRVDTREEFSEALVQFHPDVILSDHSMPQFNSIEALKIYNQLQLGVPFILVTGSVSEEFAVSCLKQGADDYILKSNLMRLPRAIENALQHRRQLLRQKQSDQELKSQFEALVKINQELDNFVYSVSHNIRSPLASVMGLLDLVQREDENRDRFFHDYLDMMQRSVRKLDDTIKEILEYSRNARSEVVNEPIAMTGLIHQCLEGLKFREGFAHVTQQIAVAGDYILYSDSYRLRIVLSNVICNAIQYRDENKKECKLNIHILLQEDITSITIEDNGIGIDSTLLPRIFDMFFRGTLKSDGAGLGLYIAREILHKLDGEIRLDSHPGIGTVCKIKLPTKPKSS